MAALLKTRMTAVWAVLVVITMAAWGMGHGFPFEDVTQAAIAIILLAMAKVRFVVMEFMELRRSPLPIRVAADGWIVAMCALLVALYLDHSTIAKQLETKTIILDASPAGITRD